MEEKKIKFKTYIHLMIHKKTILDDKMSHQIIIYEISNKFHKNTQERNNFCTLLMAALVRMDIKKIED